MRSRLTNLIRPTLTAVLAAVGLMGCLSVSHTPFEPTPEPDLDLSSSMVPAPSDVYEPSHEPIPIELTLESDNPDYTTLLISTISEGENMQPGRLVTGRYHQSKVAGERPLVVVLPIWAASARPQRSTVKRLLTGDGAPAFDILAPDGVGALVDWEGLWNAESEQAYIATLDRFVDAFTVTVRDIRRLIGWVADRPDVDPERIALVGFSASAIVGAVVVATEPEVDAAVLVLGGGRPHEIMASCPRRTGRARRHILELTGWSQETYRQRLEPVLEEIDPVRYTSSVDPSTILFIDAADDECMPSPAREDLWTALGRPERITLPFNHVHAFLTMTPLYRSWTTRQIVAFLEQSLLKPDSRTAGSTSDVGTP